MGIRRIFERLMGLAEKIKPEYSLRELADILHVNYNTFRREIRSLLDADVVEQVKRGRYKFKGSPTLEDVKRHIISKRQYWNYIRDRFKKPKYMKRSHH